jgi:hypothetical protein
MCFVGDHADFNGGKPGSHGALFAHDAAPDATGPTVLYVNPPNGAANQALTTREGLALDENIDNRDLDAGKVLVRPQGGQPLAGQWVHSLGVANFTPAAPLVRGITYEVVVPAGAVKDWMGNANAREFVSRFYTGPALAVYPGKGRAAPRLLLRFAGGRLRFEDGPWFDLRGARLRSAASAPMLTWPQPGQP